MAEASDGKPLQADLRRAISTAYYAMFHCLAECCADSMVGGSGSRRSKQAWQRVYRTLEHGYAKSQCMDQGAMSAFSGGIQNFAAIFAAMQKKRHDADYDPSAKFLKSAVVTDIAIAKEVIEKFPKAPMKDRRAFAAWVLLKPKSH